MPIVFDYESMLKIRPPVAIDVSSTRNEMTCPKRPQDNDILWWRRTPDGFELYISDFLSAPKQWPKTMLIKPRDHFGTWTEPLASNFSVLGATHFRIFVKETTIPKMNYMLPGRVDDHIVRQLCFWPSVKYINIIRWKNKMWNLIFTFSFDLCLLIVVNFWLV